MTSFTLNYVRKNLHYTDSNDRQRIISDRGGSHHYLGGSTSTRAPVCFVYDIKTHRKVDIHRPLIQDQILSIYLHNRGQGAQSGNFSYLEKRGMDKKERRSDEQSYTRTVTRWKLVCLLPLWDPYRLVQLSSGSGNNRSTLFRRMKYWSVSTLPLYLVTEKFRLGH